MDNFYNETEIFEERAEAYAHTKLSSSSIFCDYFLMLTHELGSFGEKIKKCFKMLREVKKQKALIYKRRKKLKEQWEAVESGKITMDEFEANNSSPHIQMVDFDERNNPELKFRKKLAASNLSKAEIMRQYRCYFRLYSPQLPRFQYNFFQNVLGN